MPSGSDVYRHIAEQTREIVGDAIVGVGAFEPASKTLATCAVLGLGNLSEPLTTLLGCDIARWRGRMTDEALAALATARLLPIRGGLYELFFKQPPMGFSRWVERFCGLGALFAIGLVTDGQLRGDVVICLRRGATLVNGGEIEAFAAQSAALLAESSPRDHPSGRLPR